MGLNDQITGQHTPPGGLDPKVADSLADAALRHAESQSGPDTPKSVVDTIAIGLFAGLIATVFGKKR